MVKDLRRVIGSKGHLATAEQLRVGVLVVDARHAYGRVDYEVRPLNGTGSAWVSSGRVTLEVKR